MEYVKKNINGQAYGQRDPVVEYKKKGFEPAEETVIPEEERTEIIEKNRL